jgi:hypothetical protein
MDDLFLPGWQAMSSPSSPPPRTPDPSAPYWLQTIPPFQANGSGLPLSIPLDNEPTDVQPQQWLTTKQESSALPLPPTLAPTFPSFPPNLSWNDGTRQLPQIPVRPAAQRGGADGPTQLNSDRGRNIPGLWPNFPAPGYANRAPDETPTTLPPPYNAVAASPTEQARSSQPWPISSLDNLGIGGRPIESRSATRNPQIMSDVLPDNTWIPGARYAAEERNSGGVPARIEGREFEIEGGLAGRLVEAQTRAEHALAQVRKLDPNWRPRPSFFEGVQGAIRAYESEAEQAQARLRELAVRDLWERIPKERPPAARDRNDIARDTARWFAKHHRHVIEGVAWLSELEPSIEAYLDPPKSLEDLQRAVSYARAGSDIHHIVEKTSAEEDGFPKSMIHGRENLVRIPRFKHWEITSWYMTKNENYDGLSPRDYLRGRDWDERRRVGLDALVWHGVLK